MYVCRRERMREREETERIVRNKLAKKKKNQLIIKS